MPNAITDAHEPTEAEIQHAAYLIWLENGQQPGRDLENWFAARELLRHRHAPGKNRLHGAPLIPPPIPTNGKVRKK